MADDYGQYMRDEGDAYAPLTRPRGNAPLPPEKTVKHLTNLINAEVLQAETERKAFVDGVNTAWRDYRKEPYPADQLPMADMTVTRVPLTESRVDQAVGSLMQSLNITPFATAEVDGGESGDVAHHAGLALSQELRDVAFPNLLETGLTGAVVAGTGVLKDGVVNGRLYPTVVPIQDLILSPHAPRDIEQCTMAAERYSEPLRWVRDQALAGLFDKECVRKLSGSLGWSDDDGGSVERDALRLPQGDGWNTRETHRIELLEVYLRVRPSPQRETEMWRCVCARESGAGVVILRAEPWTDGFPYTPLRIQRNSTVLYGNGYPAKLSSLQYAADMINSAAMEADFASTAPYWEVDETQPAGKVLKARAVQRGGAVRPRPGEIFWRKGSAEAVRAIHVNPAPPAIQQRMNQLEAYANVSTIPVLPMQTTRSATEHRFAQSNVSAKENMMLHALRADLSRFLTRCAAQYRKYVAEPYSPDSFHVQHGTTRYWVRDREWSALRWTPTGMTSQADQMLRMAATQEVITLVEMFWSKLPAFQQISPIAVAAHWEAYRMRLEALGIQEWIKLIGESPTRDPRVTELGQDALLGSQMLMGGQQGMSPQGLGPVGAPVRGSDGAPTVPPGGAPLAPGAPGDGGFN